MNFEVDADREVSVRELQKRLNAKFVVRNKRVNKRHQQETAEIGLGANGDTLLPDSSEGE